MMLDRDTADLVRTHGSSALDVIAGRRPTTSRRMREFFTGPGAAAPDDVTTASTHQLGAAVGISRQLGDSGAALADAVRTSFVNG